MIRLRHLRFRKCERGVDRSDDVIEFGQDFVGKIERAVAQNIALDSGKKPEVFEVCC